MEKADQVPARHKVLITGSSGMLGTDLCQELGRDYEVIGADLVYRISYIVYRFYKCDITKKKSIEAVAKKVKPDIVIHAAAMTDVDGCELDPKKAYQINSEGTKKVALACKAVKATFIYISTDFIFNGKKKKPYRENDKPRPLSIYGDSKLKGEEAVKKILKRYFIIRTSWLYGKCGKNFVDTILDKAKNCNELKVVDDQIGSPTYSKDLAAAIHALIAVIARRPQADEAIPKKEIASVLLRRCLAVPRNDIYGTYHITNSGSVSWYDYAREILRLARSRTKVLPISSMELARPARRPAMSVLDNSKFIEFTGYKMRHWKIALREYISGKAKKGVSC